MHLVISTLGEITQAAFSLPFQRLQKFLTEPYCYTEEKDTNPPGKELYSFFYYLFSFVLNLKSFSIKPLWFSLST